MVALTKIISAWEARNLARFLVVQGENGYEENRIVFGIARFGGNDSIRRWRRTAERRYRKRRDYGGDRLVYASGD
jgi:hypothetical protein